MNKESQNHGFLIPKISEHNPTRKFAIIIKNGVLEIYPEDTLIIPEEQINGIIDSLRQIGINITDVIYNPLCG